MATGSLATYGSLVGFGSLVPFGFSSQSSFTLEVTAIYLATVLGFPSTMRSKLIGIAIGYPVVFVINIIRIVVLFILGFRIPEVFEAVHYYYAQAFVIVATIGVWLLWVSLFTDNESKARHPVPG